MSAYVGFVVVVVLWLGICVEVAVDRILPISIYTPPPSLPPSLSPSLVFFFSLLPTILSLTQVTVLFEINVRLKLVSVPFSSLDFVIGHLEKSFPESIMISSEMGQS